MNDIRAVYKWENCPFNGSRNMCLAKSNPDVNDCPSWCEDTDLDVIPHNCPLKSGDITVKLMF